MIFWTRTKSKLKGLFGQRVIVMKKSTYNERVMTPDEEKVFEESFEEVSKAFSHVSKAFEKIRKIK